VLDTNVLLHNPNALFVFQDNHVVIPYPVIEELDKMKRRRRHRAQRPRGIRHLDRLREGGKLTDGVDWGEILVARPEPAFGPGPDGTTGTSGSTPRARPPAGDRRGQARQPHHRGRARPAWSAATPRCSSPRT
jgi:hypothetical protein